MQLISLPSKWRTFVVAGIVCLGIGFFLGRFTTSASRPRDVSLDTQTYHTCMYLYRDVAGCAEVMKRLAADRGEAK
jgi:hypothetical protein